MACPANAKHPLLHSILRPPTTLSAQSTPCPAQNKPQSASPHGASPTLPAISCTVQHFHIHLNTLGVIPGFSFQSLSRYEAGQRISTAIPHAKRPTTSPFTTTKLVKASPLAERKRLKPITSNYKFCVPSSLPIGWLYNEEISISFSKILIPDETQVSSLCGLPNPRRCFPLYALCSYMFKLPQFHQVFPLDTTITTGVRKKYFPSFRTSLRGEISINCSKRLLSAKGGSK